MKSASEKFDDVHKNGLKRHPKTWFIANRAATFGINLDLSIPANKLLVSKIVLKVLDAIETNAVR